MSQEIVETGFHDRPERDPLRGPRRQPRNKGPVALDAETFAAVSAAAGASRRHAQLDWRAAKLQAVQAFFGLIGAIGRR